MSNPQVIHRDTFNDLTGRRFGRWLVLAETPQARPGPSKWRCQCDCGRIKEAVGYTGLTKGRSRSCGCLRKQLFTKPIDQVHGQRNPTYRVWQSMRTRCCNEKHPTYARYGARGIGICPQWKDDFDQFLKDMGPRPPGLTLERVDNSKGYSPENCKWATLFQQAGNTRRNIRVRWKGYECNLIDVARLENVDYPCLHQRLIHKRMVLEDAVAQLQEAGNVFFERASGNKKHDKKTAQVRRRSKNFWD